MKNFERLNKNEMKMVMGGTEPVQTIDGCDNQCESDGDCHADYPNCKNVACSPGNSDTTFYKVCLL